MRSLIFSLILLTLAVSLMLGGTFYLRSNCDQLLQSLPATAREQDEVLLSQQSAHWEKRAPVYCLIAPRNGVRRVRELLLMLQSCQQSGWTAAADVTLAQLRDAVQQLKKDTLAVIPQ